MKRLLWNLERLELNLEQVEVELKSSTVLVGEAPEAYIVDIPQILLQVIYKSQLDCWISRIMEIISNDLQTLCT